MKKWLFSEIEMHSLYEPIRDHVDDVITEGIHAQTFRKGDHSIILYFGVEDTPYIRLDINGKIYKDIILSCKVENRTVRYYCKDNVEFVFCRIFDYIDMFIKKKEIICRYFIIQSPFPFKKISFDNIMISKMEKLLE